ncbi:unnamed protein product [Malus baccata var. baccata]
MTWFKCNFDGAWDENEAFGGSGVVVRDENGKYVAAKSVQFSGVCLPMLVEILAACAAVEVGRQLEATHLIFEGDVLLVIKALQRDAVANNVPFGHLLHDFICNHFPTGSLNRVQENRIKWLID